MKVSVEKPGSPGDILAHHGVKGQKWGVRKEKSTSSRPSSGNQTVKGLEHFPKEQAAALKSVTGKIKKAYGFNIDEVAPITERRYKRYIAYVRTKSKGSNVIHMQNDPSIKFEIMSLEAQKWFVPSGGHPFESIITHESAHSMFHVRDFGGKSFRERRKTKTALEAHRESIWRKTEAQAIKDGDIPPRKTGIGKIFQVNSQIQIKNQVSRYSQYSPFIEEAEAEMFSSYHWSPNPPKYVDTFANELHKALGKKVQPFSGRKVSNA